MSRTYCEVCFNDTSKNQSYFCSDECEDKFMECLMNEVKGVR